jgi:hypothetical protein
VADSSDNHPRKGIRKKSRLLIGLKENPPGSSAWGDSLGFLKVASLLSLTLPFVPGSAPGQQLIWPWLILEGSRPCVVCSQSLLGLLSALTWKCDPHQLYRHPWPPKPTSWLTLNHTHWPICPSQVGLSNVWNGTQVIVLTPAVQRELAKRISPWGWYALEEPMTTVGFGNLHCLPCP